ncbi:MAG: hypothetical protein JNJ45_07135 [Chthonomonas sp.]|nr:hypothetical protein [Chthonomonas sp.]
MSEWQDLNLLADGQLTGDELAAAQARVASDPAAKAEYDAILQLKSAVKAEVAPVPNRESWQQAVRRLDELDRVRPVERVVQKYSWALCGVVAATLIGAHFTMRGAGNTLNPAMAQAGISPIRDRASTSDISDVLKKEGIILPPITRRGLHPTNFARMSVDGRPGTRIWMSDERGGLILDIVAGVSAIEGGEVPGTDLTRVKVNSMNGVAWVRGGNGYMLVGDRSENELAQISQRLNLR